MKLIYYITRYLFNLLPSFYFRWNYARLKKIERNCDQEELKTRLDYYFKIADAFSVPESIDTISQFQKTKGTGYYFDLKQFLHYFQKQARLAYHFGDETHVNDSPTLFKARPIEGNNANSILFKLNKRRHFNWVTDSLEFEQKENKLVWRGGAYHSLRKEFVENLWNHPLCDIGQTNAPKENVSWQKDTLSVPQQLKYKYIFCPEGNDVATNLKWAMSSNSLVFMPKPKFETWFMEGALASGVHYVELSNDTQDLENKIKYYDKHPNKAKEIIANAHRHVLRFQNNKMEDLLCLKVLEKYFTLSNQIETNKF